MILWYTVILREFKSRRIMTSCEIMWNRRSKSSNTRSCFCERLWITSIKPCQCLRQSDVLRRTPAQWRKWRNTDKRIEMGQIWTNPSRKRNSDMYISISIYILYYIILYYIALYYIILYYIILYIYIIYIIWSEKGETHLKDGEKQSDRHRTAKAKMVRIRPCHDRTEETEAARKKQRQQE